MRFEKKYLNYLIKKISKYEEYRNYLGINKFADYISMPQKGAANNPDLVYELKKR